MSKPVPVDSPFESPKKRTMELLRECARKVGLYAVLNLVLFWWRQAGYLIPEAAIPAMWVCALLTGYQLGKCVARGFRDA